MGVWQEASGHDEQRRKSLAENLLNTVELANCEFVADHNEFGRLKAAHAPKDGDVDVQVARLSALCTAFGAGGERSPMVRQPRTL